VNAAYICLRSGVEKVLVSGKESCRRPGGVDDRRLKFTLEVELESELEREGMDEDEDERDGE